MVKIDATIFVPKCRIVFSVLSICSNVIFYQFTYINNIVFVDNMASKQSLAIEQSVLGQYTSVFITQNKFYILKAHKNMYRNNKIE